ncbi:peptidase S41 family protein [Chlamydia abortus]|nr:peptidase S41 family protein [Chlamydia abortus]
MSPHVSLGFTDADIQTGRYADYIGSVKRIVLQLVEKDETASHTEESADKITES